MLVLGFALSHFEDVLFKVVQRSQVLLDDGLGNLLVTRLLVVGLAQILIVARNFYLILCPLVTSLTYLPNFVEDLLRSYHKSKLKDKL